MRPPCCICSQAWARIPTDRDRMNRPRPSCGGKPSCPGCGRSYEVRRAGKCVDDPQLHLEPIPLLVNEVAVEERQGRGQRSIVKIALPSVVG